MSAAACCNGVLGGPQPLVSSVATTDSVRARRTGVVSLANASRRELVLLASELRVTAVGGNGVCLACTPGVPPVGEVDYPPGVLMSSCT
jgi:hypothetical protein